MPVQESKIPKMCRHKAKNRAFVRLPVGEGKRTIYLGRWGSAEAQDAYDKLMTEWLGNDRQLSPAVAAAPGQAAGAYTVGDLAADFLEHAQRYYVKNGSPTDELGCFRSALKPVVEMYLELPADEFGPKTLMRVREKMIGLGWTRRYINSTTHRIKRAFRWAVAEEKIKGETWHRLAAVRNLTKGRSGAKDNPPVGPASQQVVEKILPLLSRQVRAMVELQLLTGARPGEVCMMRACDLADLTKPVWKYTPQSHKTEGHNQQRHIAIGPKSQEIIKGFLRVGKSDAYLFSPVDAMRELREQASAKGQITISFVEQVEHPQINAIEVVPQ